MTIYLWATGSANYQPWVRIPFFPNKHCILMHKMRYAPSAGAVEYTNWTSREGRDRPPNECPRYDTKKLDGEATVMLEFWGMQNTTSLLSLPGPLRTRVEALDRVLSMGQIELNCVLMQNWIVWNRTVFDIETVLGHNWIVWNRTVLTFNNVWTKTILVPNWIVYIRTVWLNWIA